MAANLSCTNDPAMQKSILDFAFDLLGLRMNLGDRQPRHRHTNRGG
jgi:hypothetical protein